VVVDIHMLSPTQFGVVVKILTKKISLALNLPLRIKALYGVSRGMVMRS